MLNKTKLLSEIEDVIYTSENKEEADKLMKKYISLINSFKSTDYNFTVQSYPLQICIKHKAYSKKFSLSYKLNSWYLNKQTILPNELEKKLEEFFFLTKI